MSDLALDIGGANIKAAFGPRGGDAKECRTAGVAFALWKEPQKLAEKLHAIAESFPPFDRLLVTMTAELCDCFATKRDGVNHVLDAVETLAGGRAARVWTTTGGFVSPAEARANPLGCAAANWHALGTYVARLYPQALALLIDTGSTTTDLVRLRHGKLASGGLTDMQRLNSSELVYIGARRTPLAALGTSVEWRGGSYGVMAEYFATTADVFTMTGDLPEEPGRIDSADGRPMSVACAAARIARMIGADLDTMSLDDARELAFAFSMSATERISRAIETVLAGEVPERVIYSGSGDFLAALAAEEGIPGVRGERLAERIGAGASEAACAYALLQLADAP